ncbi:response regulator, partial [Providencia rettgeri]|nr:response regulator [Providencia rettgeri]
MKIIIVDDTYEKVEKIAKEIKDSNLHDYQLIHCSNSQDALNSMVETNFDLLFLDIQLPEALGEPIKEDAGINLIELIKINPKVNVPTHIV